MISFENVTKVYGNLVAVDGVSCTIHKGESFALLGPNGAGKTTLVRMLLGFSRCTAGSIVIKGLPAGTSASRKKVGYLAELHRIPPYLSGVEYLIRHAAFCGLTGSRAKTSVGEILERVGMNGHEKRKSSQYSRGMTQRIGLGAALLGNPELLVLDEPVSGLDPLGMRDVRVLLEEFKRNGGTILLNSHLLSEVERFCDSVAIMNKGRIVLRGDLSHIVHENETLEDVFIRHVEERQDEPKQRAQTPPLAAGNASGPNRAESPPELEDPLQVSAGSNLTRLCLVTLRDQARQKSFYLLLAIAVAFVLLIRGCYQGDYFVNGRHVDNLTIARHASLLVFHLVAAGMFLMTSMLSMGIFSRDRGDGSMVMFLSRPVDRWQYVLGRMVGTWALSTAFMFILHLIIFLIALANTGEMITGYLAASLLCSVNLLFAIVLTCFLSLFLPNSMAAIFSLGIIGISFLSDGAHQVMRSELIRQMLSSEGQTALWRIIFPKVYMLQHYASTSITNNAFDGMPASYVWSNMVFYTGALAAAALWRFYRSEI